MGDTTSLIETAIMAAEQVEAAAAIASAPTALAELIADRCRPLTISSLLPERKGNLVDGSGRKEASCIGARY